MRNIKNNSKNIGCHWLNSRKVKSNKIQFEVIIGLRHRIQVIQQEL